MSKVRIGIIGPGKIAHRFLKGARMVSDCEVYAVGSRDRERAKSFAEEYDIPYFGLYNDLVSDDNVDAVYIATPNKTHYDLVKLCLENGKHVLCEKPMFDTIEQLTEMYELAYSKNLILMEAMKALFLPLTERIRKLIDRKEIGDVQYMDGKYSYNGGFDSDHWVYDKASGGGLRDVGVYPIGYFNYLANSTVKDVKSMSRVSNTGADDFTHALVEYENGIISSSFGGLTINTENKAIIYGTKGYIEIFNFWKTSTARLVKGKYYSTLTSEMVDDFKYEIGHFVMCIQKKLKESPVIGYKQCLDIMKVYMVKENED